MASAGDNTESNTRATQEKNLTTKHDHCQLSMDSEDKQPCTPMARRVLVKLSDNLVSSPQARRVFMNTKRIRESEGKGSVMATPPPQSTPKRPTFCHQSSKTSSKGTKVMTTPVSFSKREERSVDNYLRQGKGFVIATPPPQSTPKCPTFCQQSSNTSGKGTNVMTTPVSCSKREERSVDKYFLTPSSLMGHRQNRTTSMQGGEASAKRKLATAMVYGTLRKPPCINNDDDDKKTPCMNDDDDARKASNHSLLRMKLEGLLLKADTSTSTTSAETTTSDIIEGHVAMLIKQPLKFKMRPVIVPSSPALRVKVKESKPSPFSSSKSNAKCR